MADPAYEIQTVDRLVAVINQGDDGADATRDYREIMELLPARVQMHGGKHKAKLVLTIEFVADQKGIDVSLSSEKKMPKRPVLKERFFVSERGTLTAQDPGKDTLFPGADMGRGPRTTAS
jgi:hypothetical protein